MSVNRCFIKSLLPMKLAFASRQMSCLYVKPNRVSWEKSNNITVMRTFAAVVPTPAADIEFEELREKLKNNEIILIDCRTEKEITKTGIIPKAVNIPLDCLGDVIMLPEKKFEEAIAIKKPSQEANIVTMCLAGMRARTAQFALMGAGYHNVRQYRGSFRDWISNDGPVEFRSSNDD